MSLAIQTAVGEIGHKAVTEISLSFISMVNCGQFQYGFNYDGIFLLNSGNTDDLTEFASSFTLATSDFGIKNYKRFRRIYLQVEVYGDTDFIISVKPNNGSWINKTVSVTGAGVKIVRFTINKQNGEGNFHTVKISSVSQFRIHNISGLFVVKSLGFRG